jgi:hypothetical protein
MQPLKVLAQFGRQRVYCCGVGEWKRTVDICALDEIQQLPREVRYQRVAAALALLSALSNPIRIAWPAAD